MNYSHKEDHYNGGVDVTSSYSSSSSAKNSDLCLKRTPQSAYASTEAVNPNAACRDATTTTTNTLTVEEMRYVVPQSLMWVKENKWLLACLGIVPIIGGLFQVMYGNLNRACGSMLGAPAWGAIMSNTEASILTWIIAAPSWISGPPFKPGVRVLLDWIGEKWYTRFLVLMGGVFGGGYCLLSTYITTWIGSGLFFIFCILGQVLGSLTVDMTGFMWAPKQKLLWYSYVAALVVAVGALVYDGQNFIDMANGDFTGSISQTALGIPLAILGGFIYVCQACVNTEVSRHIGGTRRGLCWTYSCEAIFVVTIFVPIYPHPTFDQVTSNDWWKFTAGLFALSCQAINMVVPVFLGFSLNYCYVIGGQLISSLLFDNFGLLEGDTYHADAWRISGCIAVMAGVAAMQWAKSYASKQRRAQSLLEEESGIFSVQISSIEDDNVINAPITAIKENQGDL